ncbi:MAG: PSD1 and planctomycete cytochrome C domain-containing protein [Pirellulaceae bacterium]
MNLLRILYSLRIPNPLRILLTVAIGAAGSLSLGAAEPMVSFNRQIKPILAGKCFTCHGPDEKERQAELRLDVRDEAVPLVIKPGDAVHSELFVRITSDDKDLQMPPADSKKPGMTADEVALIRQWIEQGAEYDAHWSYVPPVRPAPPAVKDAAWTAGEIDRFVLARLEAKGLAPSLPADQRTLLRRLSFDVVGLPPTPQELADFAADDSPQAWEKQVDRLLASRHYGERLALYWLDVVRYADTAGYHSDNFRDLSPYRDYVIAAFNDNKPFDQFTIEQLAGDLLPDASGEQRIASGYNRLLQTTEEGGAQPKEYTAKYAADRVRNTSAIWLASTMGCCECHAHKFDPFTHQDFYRFAAFFADVSEKGVGRQEQASIPTPEQELQLAQLDQQLAAARAQFAAKTPELTAARAKWEAAAQAELASSAGTWLIAKPSKVQAKSKTVLTPQDDGTLVASGPNPPKEIYTITLPADGDGIRGLRLEALVDGSFPNKGLSRANGNFVLSEIEVAALAADGKSTPVKLAAAAADFSQDGHPIANAIDGKADTGWAVAGHEKPADRAAAFTFAETVGGTGNSLVVTLKHESEFAGHNIGRFRLSLTESEKPSLSGAGIPAAVAEAMQLDAAKRSPEHEELLDGEFRRAAPELASVRQQIAKLESDRAKLIQAFPSTLVSMSAEPRTIRVLPRGNWLDDSGDVMQPAVPGFLSDASQKRSATDAPSRQTRLDLARWMTDRQNPLTARVFVNRMWKLAFGRGISRSLDDFGSQGELPTHPDLLDWLAVEFMESGWDVKHTFKLMLLSAAYRQSSVPNELALAEDATNDLFSRQNRFRLDAEFVRDNALATSGLLVPTIGGPSVKPYQPAGYWQYLNFPKREWENDQGDGLYRRGLYTFWQRTFLHPSLAAFDAPSREECTVERARSNTPQQALVLLNDPTYVEAARALAGRILAEGGKSTPERLEYAFRRVLVRPPRPEEVQLLSALVEKHQQEFAADKAAAAKLLSVGDLKSPAELHLAELAAWTSASRVLLNLHETITRN